MYEPLRDVGMLLLLFVDVVVVMVVVVVFLKRPGMVEIVSWSPSSWEAMEGDGPRHFRAVEVQEQQHVHNTTGHDTITLEMVQDAKREIQDARSSPQHHASKRFAAKGYAQYSDRDFLVSSVCCVSAGVDYLL